MKKFNNTYILGIFLVMACTASVEKPKITLKNYETQALTAKGVVLKIMDEPDFHKMHEVAIAIESSRAVSCVLVSEECNLLSQILNKIVNSSQKALPSDADRVLIFKMINQLELELLKGRAKLKGMWKSYEAHLSKKK